MNGAGSSPTWKQKLSGALAESVFLRAGKRIHEENPGDPYLKTNLWHKFLSNAYLILSDHAKGEFHTEVVTYPRHMTVGGHPTSLPYDRGRHPIQWQIVLGYTVSAFTFFQIEEGVDTGPVLWTVPYSLPDRSEPAASLEADLAAELGARQLANLLLSGNIDQQAQPGLGTLWRKRDAHDGCLDFRMSCAAIQRLVRTRYATLWCSDRARNVTATNAHRPPTHRQGLGSVHHAQASYLEVEADDGIVAITVTRPISQLETWIHPLSHYPKP